MHLINAENFEQFVSQYADRLSLIHFHADWNPLDDKMCRVTDEVNAVIGDQMGLARVEVSDPSNEALIDHVGVTHVPALFFVFRHRVVDYKVGYSKTRLVGHVQQLMQQFSPYSADPPKPINPGPFPSGIVLPPPQNSQHHPPQQMGAHGPAGLQPGIGHQGGNGGASGAMMPPIGSASHLDHGPNSGNFDPSQLHQLNGGGSQRPSHSFGADGGARYGQANPNRPLFGLIPHQITEDAPKKSWWSRLLG